MNKIKKFLMNIWYGLPFGMKAANEELTSGVASQGNGISIQEEVSDKRVGRHLLKGEITNEVEELRYRTYRVADESENYKYIGSGTAIKDEKNNGNNKKKHKFTQENRNVCESVLDGLNQVGSYGIEKYWFEIDYNYFVRFKLEKFATRVDVNINDDVGLIETTLHFNSEPNPYDSASKPFINELAKLINLENKHAIDRNEIAQCVKNLSFVTYKSDNEDDLVTYSFVNGGKFKSIEKKGYEYLITLEWSEYMRVPLNLEAKFYSKSMADKYENKEKKYQDGLMQESERKRYCSVCGKEMPVYDADIQEADGHKAICKECMNKIVK